MRRAISLQAQQHNDYMVGGGAGDAKVMVY
jgi:hypothetical protein